MICPRWGRGEEGLLVQSCRRPCGGSGWRGWGCWRGAQVEETLSELSLRNFYGGGAAKRCLAVNWENELPCVAGTLGVGACRAGGLRAESAQKVSLHSPPEGNETLV